MNTSVKEIVDLGYKICNRIDDIILNERKMNDEMALYLEHVNFQLFRTMNDIQEIEYRFGV